MVGRMSVSLGSFDLSLERPLLNRLKRAFIARPVRRNADDGGDEKENKSTEGGEGERKEMCAEKECHVVASRLPARVADDSYRPTAYGGTATGYTLLVHYWYTTGILLVYYVAGNTSIHYW